MNGSDESLSRTPGGSSADGNNVLAGYLPEVASVVAHDLNNCLNGIMLQLALVTQSVPEGVRRDIEVIRGLGQAAAANVRKLQQVNPREAGPTEVIDLNEVVAAHGDAGSVTDLGSGLPAVRAAPQALARLVRLLVRSARAACPNGSVRLMTRRTDAGATVRVEDDGPPVDEAALQQSGDAFGLLRPGFDDLTWAVARQLARRAGGDIRAANQPRGIAVTITFPAA